MSWKSIGSLAMLRETSTLILITTTTLIHYPTLLPLPTNKSLLPVEALRIPF